MIDRLFFVSSLGDDIGMEESGKNQLNTIDHVNKRNLRLWQKARDHGHPKRKM